MVSPAGDNGGIEAVGGAAGAGGAVGGAVVAGGAVAGGAVVGGAVMVGRAVVVVGRAVVVVGRATVAGGAVVVVVVEGDVGVVIDGEDVGLARLASVVDGAGDPEATASGSAALSSPEPMVTAAATKPPTTARTAKATAAQRRDNVSMLMGGGYSPIGREDGQPPAVTPRRAFGASPIEVIARRCDQCYLAPRFPYQDIEQPRRNMSMPSLPTRRPTRKVAAAMALTLGGLAFWVGAPPASAAPLDGSAFGLSANITVGGEEVVDLPPTPAVDCPPDDSETVVSVSLPEALPEVPGVPPLPMDTILESGTLTAECSTTDGVVTSTASVEDLNLFDQITASVLEAECTANGDPTGSANVAELVLGGEPIEVTGEPNQVVEIPGEFGTVTINRQTVTENPDGTSTITVDALVVDLDVPGAGFPGVTADLIVSSVSCTSSVAEAPPATTAPATTAPATTAPATTAPATTAPPTTGDPDPVAPPAIPVEGDADFTG